MRPTKTTNGGIPIIRMGHETHTNNVHNSAQLSAQPQMTRYHNVNICISDGDALEVCPKKHAQTRTIPPKQRPTSGSCMLMCALRTLINAPVAHAMRSRWGQTWPFMAAAVVVVNSETSVLFDVVINWESKRKAVYRSTDVFTRICSLFYHSVADRSAHE